MPVFRSNSSTLEDFLAACPWEGRNGAVAAASSADIPRRETDVSCCSPALPNAAGEDEEQTVMTAVSSYSSLLSFASSTTRDEAEQTLRKRPSFQSLEEALLLAGGGVCNSSDSTDTASALSSSSSSSSPSPSPADAKKEEEQVVTQDESFATQPLKKVRSASSLQDLIIIQKPVMKEEEALPDYKTVGVDPDMYLVQLIQAMHGGVKVQPKAALELNDFFPTIAEEQMAAYNMEVVTATRQNQVEKLREIVATQGPEAVDCFNRFGESLLNLACRRGFTDIVSFFIHEVGLSVRTRDDGGRTPMHDACWNAEPLLDICTWLVEKDPSLLLIKDKRGYTAFQYARKSHWHIWRKFLFDNRHAIAEGLAQQPDLVRIFSSQ